MSHLNRCLWNIYASKLCLVAAASYWCILKILIRYLFWLKVKAKTFTCYWNQFFNGGHCNIDLQSSDLKICRGDFLVMSNLWTKFGESGPKQSQVIDQKPILHCDLALWLSNFRIFGTIYWSWSTTRPSLVNIDQSFHKLLSQSRNCLAYGLTDPSTLTKR